MPRRIDEKSYAAALQQATGATSDKQPRHTLHICINMATNQIQNDAGSCMKWPDHRFYILRRSFDAQAFLVHCLCMLLDMDMLFGCMQCTCTDSSGWNKRKMCYYSHRRNEKNERKVHSKARNMMRWARRRKRAEKIIAIVKSSTKPYVLVGMLPTNSGSCWLFLYSKDANVRGGKGGADFM